MPCKALVLFLGFTWALGAQAATTLTLVVPNGLQGTIVQGSLEIATDTATAGVNAELILPAGVSVNAVQKGDLLAPPANYQLDFQINGSNLRVIAWSATHTFTGSGEVIKLALQLSGGLLGLKAVNFAAVNPIPQINSRHAVSNYDGSQSLTHDTVNASFLAYSASSDFDGDGMPDAWEEENELDPLADNDEADADGDGFTDLEEYDGGSDPQDADSVPDVLFKDSFENLPP
jgi:hypothetical protein